VAERDVLIDPMHVRGADNWFGNFGRISVSALDLSARVKFWEETLGIGPWLIFWVLIMEAIHE